MQTEHPQDPSSRPIGAVAHPVGSVLQPELLVAGTPPRHSGYRLRYGLRAASGETLLQRVETRIRYRCGALVAVSYRGVYWEYFRFADASPRVDVHDFDMQRDGWDPGTLKRLLRDRGLRGLPPGEPALECEKRFFLGLGSTEGARPSLRTADRGAFGFLESVGGERASAEVRLLGTDPWVPWEGVPATEACGTGALQAEAGWVATERFVYRFATRGRDLRAEGYRAGHHFGNTRSCA